VTVTHLNQIAAQELNHGVKISAHVVAPMNKQNALVDRNLINLLAHVDVHLEKIRIAPVKLSGLMLHVLVAVEMLAEIVVMQRNSTKINVNVNVKTRKK
jgi:hypothetical protein